MLLSLEDIGQKYIQSPSFSISTGLRPSGHIHYANGITLGFAGLLQALPGLKPATMQVTICDYDRPGRELWPIKKHGFVKYFSQLIDEESNNNLVNVTTNEVKEFCSELENILNININVQLLSEIQRNVEYRLGIKKIIEDPNKMVKVFNLLEGTAPVFPLCSECKTSGAYPHKYENEEIAYQCYNKDCTQYERQKKMSILDTSIDLAVNFILDPVRDICVNPQAQVHVFGGDYNDAHGNKGLTKAGCVAELVDGVGEKELDFFVGLKIVTEEGSFSKSGKIGGTWHKTKQEQSPKKIVERIVADTYAYLGIHSMPPNLEIDVFSE